MTSSHIAWWGGLAAMVGGALLAAKGVVIAFSALLAALVGLFAGSVLLGIAHLRAGALRPGWRVVPLIIGVVWLPLMDIGAFMGEGSVLTGLAWVVLGYIVWSEKGVAGQNPTRVS